MSVNIALNTFKNIYRNPFKKYLSFSESIGGLIHEQSVIVDNVFKLTLNLLDTLYKYKKPINPADERYLIDQLIQEVSKVTSTESKASDYIFEITLISKSIKIFEWFEEDDVVKFVTNLNNYIEFYKQKAQNEIETLGKVHLEWFKSWTETYEELSLFIVSFFKDGIVWSGTLNLPTCQLSGDNHNLKKTLERQALLTEINKGDLIQNVLRDGCKSNEKKWKIEHQKGSHSMIINTARKEDCIFIYNCQDCTIVIENIIDSVNIDMCNMVTVLLRSVTRIEMTDSQDCNVHCFDKVTGLDLISCEKVGLYMSEKSLDTRITTTKCCGINVNFPFDDGLYQSFMISDQLVTKILPNNGIETTINKI